jgi:uncharacterized membrane protein
MEFSDLFTFKKFVAPVLIQISYWVGLVLIVLMTLVGIAGTSVFSSYYYGGGGFSVGGALLSLVGGVFGALIWRVVCEIWIVIFSVNDRLGTLVALKKAEQGK